MAKARVIANDDEVSPEAERMADLNEQEGGDLYRAIEEARSTQGAEVILTRTMPADKAGFCDKIPVAEFDLTLLKTRYGPGTYRVRFNGPTGFLPGGSTIKVAPAQEKPAASASGATDLASLLEIMDRKEAERRARTDDWIKLAIPVVGTIATALISRPAAGGTDVAALVAALKPAPGPSLAELSQAVVNMKTMTQPAESGSNVDTILKVFEAAQGMMGGDKDGADKGNSSNWIDIVRDLIKAAPAAIQPMLQARMGAMMQARQGSPVAQVQPQIQTPAPAVSPVAAAATPAPTEGNNEMMLKLFMPVIRENLAKVVTWAQRDRDPAIYADVLVDELPDNFGHYMPLDKVLMYLNHEQWFEEICKIEPGLQPYREWCDECRQGIIDIMQGEESEPEADAAPAAPSEEINKGVSGDDASTIQ